MKRLTLVRASAPDVGADALRGLARALAPYLRDELGLEQREGEQLVDVAAVVPLPRRAVFAACRRGDIAGATKRSRRWVATRAALDAWLRAGGPRLVSASSTDDGDELTEMRSRLARASTPRRHRSRRSG